MVVDRTMVVIIPFCEPKIIHSLRPMMLYCIVVMFMIFVHVLHTYEQLCIPTLCTTFTHLNSSLGFWNPLTEEENK